MKELGLVGLIGRWKPLHNAGAVILETLCEKAEHVIIGIGSCNKYNLRNPFTAEESKEMIDAVLGRKYSNYSFVFIPDFAHIPEYRDGKKWKQYLIEQYGKLDCFVSGNEYVYELLKDDYNVIHPAELIPPEKQIKLKATQVRVEIAKNGNWKSLVPEPVVEYLEKNKLVARFRKEFGLAALASLADNYKGHETMEQERAHTYEK